MCCNPIQNRKFYRL